ncbi:hypothetical protein GPALN_005885 [Globodera pallida]|nr:hypothetical protein GPALN_005885 [Globodera pallida]
MTLPILCASLNKYHFPGLASHYGAMPSQQVPPMDDTFVPSQAGTDSMNWLGENLQSNDGDLDSVVRPKNTSLFKRALGFMSSLGGASPQEPQFSPSMHDTSAASSYYPSNQPDDGTLQSMITPRNQKASHYGSAMSYQQVPPVQDTFVPSQAGTDSTNFFGWNSQNNDGDLASVFRPKNTSSSASKGFYGTPFLPNQSQSTRRTGASNYFSPTPNTSNFTSGNPGSSSYYGSAMPFQQAPITQKELQEKLKDIGVELHAPTLSTYLERIQAIDGGSRKSAFELFKANRRAMDLLELLEELGKIKVNIDKKTLIKYRKKLKEEAQQNPGFGATAHLPNQSQSTEMLDFSNPAPFIQAPQIAQQSSNFTSGNPGSSRSASEKGKSTNFSKKNSGNWSLSSIKGFVSDLVGASPQEPQFSPSMHGTAEASSYYPSNQPDDQTLESMITPRNQKGSAPHYGDAMPSQQVPPMDDIFVPSHAGTDSTDWFGENLQSFLSSLVGASPQEPQFSPSIHDTSAASSYYPSNQPDDQTLESMITPRNQKGFYGTPYFPNQSQSTGWPGASNYFIPTPNTSNFTSGNPGSSAMPFQQAPMPGTSFPSFPNYPSNQSAQFNSSTNFGPFQTETHSWDWSGENSHNNTGTLDSVVNKRKPSSSKDKNATKTGKKPRK